MPILKLFSDWRYSNYKYLFCIFGTQSTCLPNLRVTWKSMWMCIKMAIYRSNITRNPFNWYIIMKFLKHRAYTLSFMNIEQNYTWWTEKCTLICQNWRGWNQWHFSVELNFISKDNTKWWKVKVNCRQKFRKCFNLLSNQFYVMQ